MQAFANNIDEKLSTKDKDDSGSLFSSDEVIFPDQTIERPYTRYGYTTAKMNFLVPEHMVSEVIQSPNIFNLPNSPSWIEGLINVRGNIIPVMNIEKFSKEISSDQLGNVLVLNKSINEPAIAVIIDDLPSALEINDSETSIRHYPSTLQNFINNGFSQNNLDWIELDIQALFKSLANKEKI
jgi:chemotaxis signal transduction protein